MAGALRQYPESRILLSAYADSRGPKYYNNALSKKRVQAALRYLVAAGIPKRHIQTAYFGEDQLVNACKDGTACTEESHQLNRRTEIKVICGNILIYSSIY